MATMDHLLVDIDRRLDDPSSKTPSISFQDDECKSYNDLFKHSKEYSSKAWEPASSNPTSMPAHPNGEYSLSRCSQAQEEEN
jgi:hypothetical protein